MRPISEATALVNHIGCSAQEQAEVALLAQHAEEGVTFILHTFVVHIINEDALSGKVDVLGRDGVYNHPPLDGELHLEARAAIEALLENLAQHIFETEGVDEVGDVLDLLSLRVRKGELRVADCIDALLHGVRKHAIQEQVVEEVVERFHTPIVS